MRLPFYIARRYLFAKKSHNVINIVSAISSVGIAVGTAALIIILSIYNGFDALVKTMLSGIEPDLAIVPAEGKFFIPEGDAYDWAYDDPRVASMCTVLKDMAFMDYEGRQRTVNVMGVDEIFEDEMPLRDRIVDGTFCLRVGERPFAAVGRSLARSMGINKNFVSPIKLYYPEKGVRISVANPMGNINVLNAWPSCEFEVNGDVDCSLIIIDRDAICELTGCTDEVSSVEIRLARPVLRKDLREVRKELERRLGPEFQVLDRMQQNPSLYKMLRYEKAAVYLIMFFIVLILGFSIFGSLRMLIIEKKDDIQTLAAIGAEQGTIRSIFTLEGWMISLLGMFAGMVIGVIFSLLQQHLGIIGMPGNYVVEAYPAILQIWDVVISCISIALMGYVIARIATRRL